MPPADRLDAIVRSTPWLLDLLQVVREHGPEGAWIAAGAVRDTVWNALTGRSRVPPRGDVDVVYFDPSEGQPESVHAAHLRAERPQYDWEVVNQAIVHRWHAAEGRAVPPAPNVAAALATWPKTVTAIALRLGADDRIEQLAPFGLDDLFGLIVRHNPAVAPRTVFEARVASKRWGCWPGSRGTTRERWLGAQRGAVCGCCVAYRAVFRDCQPRL